MPLWELQAQPAVWKELYRTAVIGERKAANQIQKREERKARMQRMMHGGRGR